MGSVRADFRRAVTSVLRSLAGAIARMTWLATIPMTLAVLYGGAGAYQSSAATSSTTYAYALGGARGYIYDAPATATTASGTRRSETFRAYDDSRNLSRPNASVSNVDLAAKAGAGAAVRTTGQTHHVISTRIASALEENPNLAGRYSMRDPRFTTEAVDAAVTCSPPELTVQAACFLVFG
jgi:hypothetical protein